MRVPLPQAGGPPSTARRDLLLSLQAAAQQKWSESKIFEVDAPQPGTVLEPGRLACPHWPCTCGVPTPPPTLRAAGQPVAGKFFGNFPYPYMNGLLHLGHAFSISKVPAPQRHARQTATGHLASTL